MVGWAPLKGGLLKWNLNFACFEQEVATGYAVIILDSMGCVLKSFSSFIYACFSPSIAKAFAIREVLSWLKSFAFDNIIVEMDCLLVISALSHPSFDFSKLGVLLRDYLLMKNKFQHTSFC